MLRSPPGAGRTTEGVEHLSPRLQRGYGSHVSPPTDSAPPTSAGPFRLGRWVGFTVLGESVGFLIPVTGFALASVLGWDGWAAWTLLVVLGAGEGALLGVGQWLGLRGSSVAVPRGLWIGATAVAASVAWALGMLIPTLMDLDVAIDWASPVTWVTVTLGALALLAVIPLAQRPLLAHVGVRRSWLWVPINVGAWLVGIVFTFLPSPFIDESSPPALTFALFAMGGILMATTVAVLTGIGLRRMLAQA